MHTGYIEMSIPTSTRPKWVKRKIEFGVTTAGDFLDKEKAGKDSSFVAKLRYYDDSKDVYLLTEPNDLMGVAVQYRLFSNHGKGKT